MILKVAFKALSCGTDMVASAKDRHLYIAPWSSAISVNSSTDLISFDNSSIVISGVNFRALFCPGNTLLPLEKIFLLDDVNKPKQQKEKSENELISNKGTSVLLLDALKTSMDNARENEVIKTLSQNGTTGELIYIYLVEGTMVLKVSKKIEQN